MEKMTSRTDQYRLYEDARNSLNPQSRRDQAMADHLGKSMTRIAASMTNAERGEVGLEPKPATPAWRKLLLASGILGAGLAGNRLMERIVSKPPEKPVPRVPARLIPNWPVEGEQAPVETVADNGRGR